MGRSANSFISWVGNTTGINADGVTLPEKDLWVAVLSRAALDACKGPPRLNMKLQSNTTHKNVYIYDRDQARHFFLKGGVHFRHVCELAGHNPDYVQQKIRKVILRKEGWNVDIPITSHYRRGRGKKRGRPRLYPKKNPMMVARGRRGGRPRLYAV